jgi:hypothetical protein
VVRGAIVLKNVWVWKLPEGEDLSKYLKKTPSATEQPLYWLADWANGKFYDRMTEEQARKWLDKEDQQ